VPQAPSVLLYFFFDFNDTFKQSLDGLLRALISQLYVEQEISRMHLNQLFLSYKHGKEKPSVERLEATLQAMAHQAGEIIVVLDALDEAQPREKLLGWMQGFVSSDFRNVHLIVTARREEDITSAISKWKHSENTISIRSDDVDEDIRAYVRARVDDDDDGLKRWKSRPDVQMEIETSLLKKTDGM